MYDKLIEKLRDDTMWENCEFDFIHSYMREAADAIEELKKQLDDAEIENIKLKEEFAKYRGKNRWIPVTERLPEENGDYLVHISCPLGKWIELDAFDGKDWQSTDGYWYEISTDVVTHWMPLPEPPEEET